MGGIIAFEMARQLREAGERVDELVIIDSMVLDPARHRGVTDRQLLTWFCWELLWLDRGATLPDVAFEEYGERETFERIADLAVKLGLLLPGHSDGALRRLFEVFRANCLAMFGNRPGVVAQDITLIRAEGSLPEVLKPIHDRSGSLWRDPVNGWRTVTSGRIDLVEVAGDHMSLVEEPYVGDVADVIAKIVLRASGAE
jgi:thioesterase domain-containing protein